MPGRRTCRACPTWGVRTRRPRSSSCVRDRSENRPVKQAFNSLGRHATHATRLITISISDYREGAAHSLSPWRVHRLVAARLQRLPAYNSAADDRLEVIERTPMRRCLTRLLGPRAMRRLYAGAALFAYAVTVVGVPAAPVSRPPGQAFICQGHACGCENAEQCWAHCCCFSPQDRSAWAVRNHVEPPPYAEQPRAGGWQVARVRDQEPGCEAGESSCCSRRAPEGRCCSEACCAEERPAGLGRLMPTVSILRCQGVNTLWVTTGVTLPIVVAEWVPASPLTGRLVLPDSVPHISRRLPLVPPPRA
jgi:hypothetical protein